MEHFVRSFKEIRSLRDGDGFYPWRRLGFAIWNIERLRMAGLVHDPKHDRKGDCAKWLSVIREEDFGTVQDHRLIVPDVFKATEGENYTYAEDSDDSSKEMHWAGAWWLPPEKNKKSLSLEFGRQASDVSQDIAFGIKWTSVRFEVNKMPNEEGLQQLCRGLGPGFNFGRSCLITAALYDSEFLTSALRALCETFNLRALPRRWTSPPPGECLRIYKHPCADHVSASYRSC